MRYNAAMAIDEQMVSRARRMKRAAVRDLLEQLYPPTHRLAMALAGREDVARGIVSFVMKKAVRQVRRFRDADSARRWFHHYTVLISRRAAAHRPSSDEECFIRRCEDRSPAYVAFIHAMRSLPIQQREAFILHYCEGLDERAMAIAMDCSTLRRGHSPARRLRNTRLHRRRGVPIPPPAHDRHLRPVYARAAAREQRG